MGFPDPDHLKKIFEKLDLMVSITFSWSDTAWYSDVVLPLSPYLSRQCVIATKNDLLPYFFIRRQAVAPRYDTRCDWEIFAGLSKRMGLAELAYEKVEDIWNFQLEGTGVTLEDFNATGLVLLGKEPKYRDVSELKFKTPSGKIEMINETLEGQGIPSLKPYESPQRPETGRFRLTFGRCGLHTQGHTVNNPVLFEQMSENVLWINDKEAKKQGIENNDLVEVSNNGHSERIRAKVTEHIHPEAVFVVHGFGHRLPVESRAFGRGLADNRLMPEGCNIYDPAGGAVAFQEHFVSVKKAKGNA
jgi:thiosulfate reductase/polysulfide reductase chain A